MQRSFGVIPYLNHFFRKTVSSKCMRHVTSLKYETQIIIILYNYNVHISATNETYLKEEVINRKQYVQIALGQQLFAITIHSHAPNDYDKIL